MIDIQDIISKLGTPLVIDDECIEKYKDYEPEIKTIRENPFEWNRACFLARNVCWIDIKGDDKYQVKSTFYKHKHAFEHVKDNKYRVTLPRSKNQIFDFALKFPSFVKNLRFISNDFDLYIGDPSNIPNVLGRSLYLTDYFTPFSYVYFEFEVDEHALDKADMHAEGDAYIIMPIVKWDATIVWGHDQKYPIFEFMDKYHNDAVSYGSMFYSKNGTLYINDQYRKYVKRKDEMKPHYVEMTDEMGDVMELRNALRVHPRDNDLRFKAIVKFIQSRNKNILEETIFKFFNETAETRFDITFIRLIYNLTCEGEERFGYEDGVKKFADGVYEKYYKFRDLQIGEYNPNNKVFRISENIAICNGEILHYNLENFKEFLSKLSH